MKATPLAGLALAAALVAAWAPGAAAAPEADGGLVAGAPLPALSGHNLVGEPTTLPEAAAGRPTLLLLGFGYGSRHAVEAWARRFRAEFARDSSAACYVVPMMSGVGARLGRPLIEAGMRGDTPKPFQRYVVVVWNGVGEWKHRVGTLERDHACLLLLDAGGRLAWSGSAGAELDGFDALATRVRDLRSR